MFYIAFLVLNSVEAYLVRNLKIIPKNTLLRKLSYTKHMRKYFSSLSKRRFIANYIGGLGYYGWYFAIFVLISQIALQASQFVVVSSQPIYDTPVSHGGVTQTATGDDVNLLFNIISAFLIILACCAVLLAPYYVAWLSRGLPRIVLAHTSTQTTLRSLHFVKQISCVALVCVATLVLFAPYTSALVNILYLTILAAVVFSALCFWVQYKIVTLWHIAERHVF